MSKIMDQVIANAEAGKKPDPNWQRSEASKKRLMFEQELSPSLRHSRSTISARPRYPRNRKTNVSYYLDFAQSIKEDNPEAAAVIEELYAAKVELENTVKRISDARDLLLKKEDQQERDCIDGMADAHRVMSKFGVDPYF